MRIKSKTTLIYLYGSRYQVLITIDPRQKWEIVGCKRDYVVISHKGVKIEIPISDYEKYFEGVKE